MVEHYDSAGEHLSAVNRFSTEVWPSRHSLCQKQIECASGLEIVGDSFT
jgi:hypothetical protein